jgi:putative spermidine/putrescine transport system permease protein
LTLTADTGAPTPGGRTHDGSDGDTLLAAGPRPGLGGRLLRLPVLGLLPFGIYTLVFLGLPLVAVLVGAFERSGGGFTFSNISAATSGIYRHGFEETLELAALTSIVPGIFGLFIAQAIDRSPQGGLLRRLTTTASGVFANFGGVPLAFLFIEALGSPRVGLVTDFLDDLGFHIYDHGFSLFTLWGVAIAYLYFQIPLMVLVITPALQGLRPAWREASDNLGASSWEYWRTIGGPVLLPSILGGVLLLFGSAMSAYATADAMTDGAVPLTSIQIGSFLNGNVIAGQENVGKALGLGLVVIILIAMIAYSLLQRRVSKWLR